MQYLFGCIGAGKSYIVRMNPPRSPSSISAVQRLSTKSRAGSVPLRRIGPVKRRSRHQMAGLSANRTLANYRELLLPPSPLSICSWRSATIVVHATIQPDFRILQAGAPSS